MDWPLALGLMLGLVCLFLAIGMPVAFAFFLTNIVGAIVFMGFDRDMVWLGLDRGMVWLARNSVAAISNFNLAPIPLFLLMGELLLQTGLAFKAVDAIDRLIRRVPGRLSVVAVTGGTIFSALSGSTIATTAMLGHALLPDMLKRGYHPTMAMGPIMAIGGVDMLIPPSALAVLLGSLAVIPIKELLIGGILPGLVMSVLFVAYIVLRCAINPKLAPAYAGVPLPDGIVRPQPLVALAALAVLAAALVFALWWLAVLAWLATVFVGVALRCAASWSYARWYWLTWAPTLIYVVPLFLIMVVVIGSIFAGVASPTDSAALGCIATALIAMTQRALTWRIMLSSLRDMAKVTAMIFFIIAASSTYAQILALSGATDGALTALLELKFTPMGALLLMVAILLVMGCFLDQVSMMLLTLPFFMPIAKQLGIDVIWLGVVFLISMQIGLLTPPFGLLLFVMKGVAPPHIKMKQVYVAALPFTVLTLLVLALVIAIPWLATSLPKLIG